MWRVRKFTNSVFKGKTAIESRFLKNLPDWPLLDKLAHSGFSRLFWVLAYVLFYVLFAPSAWWFLLVPLHIVMLPLHGVIINWFAHKYGSTNFKMKNTSTNLFKMDLLMMGEAYHNNHHKNPSSINFGFRWHEIDPTYGIIRVLNWLRIIKVNKKSGVLNHESGNLGHEI